MEIISDVYPGLESFYLSYKWDFWNSKVTESKWNQYFINIINIEIPSDLLSVTFGSKKDEEENQQKPSRNR